MRSEPKIDLSFQILGRIIPVDHGFALYSAVSGILPHFHETKNVGLKLIRGRYIGDGMLDISPHSELVFRLSPNDISQYLKLAGKTLEILGSRLAIGVPKTRAVVPGSEVYSPLVTTRNGQVQARFEAEIRNQMKLLAVQGNLSIGKRKTFTIHEKQVVGYGLKVTDLEPHMSIVLQEEGLGGRRKMGCGFFEPIGERQQAR